MQNLNGKYERVNIYQTIYKLLHYDTGVSVLRKKDCLGPWTKQTTPTDNVGIPV